ncbi:hypothetical protein BJ742DRAFT_907781 [Cladochytrium replicatum]|nr:hypothetical protein BJ742DRAFT_907781 [Cladochytrium replicatum]
MHKFGEMVDSARKRTRSNNVSADGSVDGTNSNGNELMLNSPMIASREVHSPASSSDSPVGGSTNIASVLPRWIDSVQGSRQDFPDQKNPRKQELKALWNDMMAENDYKHRMMERNEEIQTQLNDALERNQALLNQIQQLEEDRSKVWKEAELLRARERTADEERQKLERELEEAQNSSRKMYEDLKELGFEHVGLKSAMLLFEQTKAYMDENLWLANRDLTLKEHERRGLAKTIAEIHEQFLNVNQIGGSLRSSYVKQLDLHHALLRSLQLCAADSAARLLETLRQAKAAEVRQEDPHTTISQLRNDNDSLRRDIKSLQTIIADGQRESKEIRKDKSALNAKLEQVQEEIESIKHDRALLVEQNTKLGIEHRLSHSQVNDLNKQLQSVNAELDSKIFDLDQTKSKLNLANLQLEKTIAQVNDAHRDLERANIQIQRLEIEMKNMSKLSEQIAKRREIPTTGVPVRSSRLPSPTRVDHSKFLVTDFERKFPDRTDFASDTNSSRLAEISIQLYGHKIRYSENLKLISECFARISDRREFNWDDRSNEEAVRLVSRLVAVTVELRAALDGALNKISILDDEAEKQACQQSLLEIIVQSIQSLADSSKETVEQLKILGVVSDCPGTPTTTPSSHVFEEGVSGNPQLSKGMQKENRSCQHSRALTDAPSHNSPSNPQQLRRASDAAPRRRSAPVVESITSPRESTNKKAVSEKRCSVCAASPPRSHGSSSPNPSDGTASPSQSSPRHSNNIARRPLDLPSSRARISAKPKNK